MISSSRLHFAYVWLQYFFLYSSKYGTASFLYMHFLLTKISSTLVVSYLCIESTHFFQELLFIINTFLIKTYIDLYLYYRLHLQYMFVVLVDFCKLTLLHCINLCCSLEHVRMTLCLLIQLICRYGFDFCLFFWVRLASFHLFTLLYGSSVN